MCAVFSRIPAAYEVIVSDLDKRLPAIITAGLMKGTFFTLSFTDQPSVSFSSTNIVHFDHIKGRSWFYSFLISVFSQLFNLLFLENVLMVFFNDKSGLRIISPPINDVRGMFTFN